MPEKIRKAYFIDATYRIKNDQTYLALTLRGKKTVRLYYPADPYFFVDAPSDKLSSLQLISVRNQFGEEVKAKKVEIVNRKFGHKNLTLIKVYCKKPADVPILKSAIPFECFEFNIPFARRAALDLQLTPLSLIKYKRNGRIISEIIDRINDSAKLSIMSFDIETYNPQGIPREDKDPVIMISYSGIKNEVLTLKNSSKDFVTKYQNEKEMLDAFSSKIKSENPDVLVGYNSANFDLTYLLARAKANSTKLHLGRFSSQIRPQKKGLITGMSIDGRVHMDLYPIVKFFGFIGIIKTQKFNLDSVAEDVLGNKKVKITKEDIWKMWDSNDIEKLAEYSLVDAQLTKQLADRFLPIEVELSSVAKMPLFETTISTSGQLVENLLMFHAISRNELIPSKPEGEEISEREGAPIQGAFVKLPEPGIYENVAVLDFRGLYPSIIVSYNIDPATILEPTDSENEPFISPSGARFTKKEIGVIPFVLDYLIDMRMKIKNEIKKFDKSTEEYIRLAARSQALKILANSFYGYMGYARSRWYSRDCAESVTAWGRKHIMETIEHAEKSGFSVLYADTDSVFILYKNKEDVLKFMKDVNSSLPSKMELELEGFYPRGVFVSKKTHSSDDGETGAKKKYALLAEDGRIKIRGFELVRRDWSKVAKDTQLKVLEAILKEGSKEKAVKIIRETVTRLQSGKVPLEDLAISTQLNKNPQNYDIVSPELEAAKKLIAAGISAEKGTLISYVVGKNGKSISEKAYPLELAKDYDPDYYIDNQVMPSVMKIMKELGYDEYSMKFGGKQKSLDQFF